MSGLCLISPTSLVSTVRSILNDLCLNDPDRRLKFFKEDGLVAIPVKSSSTADVIKEALQERIDLNANCLEIKSVNLPSAKRLNVKSPQRTLKEKLKHLIVESGQNWTDDICKDIPNHWEIHGDLALIPDTAFSLPVWGVIGPDVWKTVVECLSCKKLARKSKISVDGYRTPQVHLLHGKHGWVEHTDNGIRYTYDVTQCMFSIGNISEKLRVAHFNCEGEIVVDLYAGIGYFTLPYLVHTGVKHLHACEWNNHAVEALQRNLILNGVQDRCTVYAGDNKVLCPKGIADRVNLGLIPSSREGWPVACSALKPGTGGMLHIHYNVNTKPGTGNQNHDSEPAEIFRCEAKCPENLVTKASGTGKSINSGTEECEGSRLEECENSRFEQCESSRTEQWKSTRCDNKKTDFHGKSPRNYEPEQSIDARSDIDTVRDNVESSKWYHWAKTTSEEIGNILQEMHKSEWITKIRHIEHVKSYAPYIDHVVLDLECRRINK